MVSAQDVASAYNRYISACWRGDAPKADLGRWLEAYRRNARPPADCSPAACSPHAAGGRGIAWFDTATHVIGVTGDGAESFAVPVEAAIPPLSEGSATDAVGAARPAAAQGSPGIPASPSCCDCAPTRCSKPRTGQVAGIASAEQRAAPVGGRRPRAAR